MRIYISRCGLAFSLVATILVAACTPDPNAEANKLFVEAQQLIEKGDKEQRQTDKLINLRDAEKHLKSIITKYPSANLAVQLTSGQSVGKLSLQTIGDAIRKAEQAACFEAPNKKCLYEQALLIAQSVQDQVIIFSWGSGSSVFSRVGFFSNVALNQAKAGLEKASIATFEQATLAYNADKKSMGGFGLNYLAPALAGAGRKLDAFRLIEDVSDEARHASLLLAIARAQAMAGLNKDASAALDQALKLRPAIGDEWVRIRWPIGIAQTQAFLGMSNEASSALDEALNLTNSVSTPNDASRIGLLYALGDIAEVQARIGQSAAANSTLARAFDVARTGSYLGNNIYTVLNGRPTIAGLADVKKLGESIPNEYMRSSVLYYGVRGRAESGRIAEAQEIIYTIKTDFFRVQALAALAQAQAKAKLTSQAAKTIETALQATQSLPNDAMRSHALLAIAQAVP